LTFLEKRRLRGGESRNKEMMKGKLSEIIVDNIKGDSLIKGD